jgi:outer membrane biosynthesis protein TonB
MRRTALFILAALCLPNAAAAAMQQSRAAAAPSGSTFVRVCSGPAHAIGAAPPATRPGNRNCVDDQLRGLLSAEDIPSDLRRRPFRGTTLLAADMGADGRPTACAVASPSGEPRLDRLACTLVTARARFRPLYAGPGRPVPARHELAFVWDIFNAAPPPMFAPAAAPLAPVDFARPGPWPRLTWWSPVELVALPRIQGSYPAGTASAGGIVGVDVLARQATGLETCVVGVSSGDAALDEAACRVARTIELRYLQPCERCGDYMVPLQVVWRHGGGSHIRYPLPATPSAGGAVKDPADTRAPDARRSRPQPIRYAVMPTDFRGIRDRNVTTYQMTVLLDIDAEGRPTVCTARGSSGNPAVDRRACEIALRRARFRPRTDVFGDPVPTPGFGQYFELPPLD